MAAKRSNSTLAGKHLSRALSFVMMVAALSAGVTIYSRGKPFDWRFAMVVAPVIAAVLGGIVWLFVGPFMSWYGGWLERQNAESVGSVKRHKALVVSLSMSEAERRALAILATCTMKAASEEDRERLSRMTDLPDSLRSLFSLYSTVHAGGLGAYISLDMISPCEDDPRLVRIGDDMDGSKIFMERETGRVTSGTPSESPLDLSEALPSVFHWILFEETDLDPSCLECGYPLRGLSDFKCPECGHDSSEWVRSMNGRAFQAGEGWSGDTEPRQVTKGPT